MYWRLSSRGLWCSFYFFFVEFFLHLTPSWKKRVQILPSWYLEDSFLSRWHNFDCFLYYRRRNWFWNWSCKLILGQALIFHLCAGAWLSSAGSSWFGREGRNIALVFLEGSGNFCSVRWGPSPGAPACSVFCSSLPWPVAPPVSQACFWSAVSGSTAAFGGCSGRSVSLLVAWPLIVF